MSRVIWKYPLEVTDRQEVAVPGEAQFLHVDVQDGQVCLWALVDPSREMETVPIHIVGTGNPMPPEDDRPSGYPCCKHCFEPGRPVAIHETPCRKCKQEED